MLLDYKIDLSDFDGCLRAFPAKTTNKATQRLWQTLQHNDETFSALEVFFDSLLQMMRPSWMLMGVAVFGGNTQDYDIVFRPEVQRDARLTLQLLHLLGPLGLRLRQNTPPRDSRITPRGAILHKSHVILLVSELWDSVRCSSSCRLNTRLKDSDSQITPREVRLLFLLHQRLGAAHS
jgi:hypothetical protein